MAFASPSWPPRRGENHIRRHRTCDKSNYRLARANHANSLGLAVGPELLEVSPKVADLLLVLDAGKYHLGAGDLGARVADVFLEHLLAPGEAGILVGLRIVVALGSARLAAIEPVELGADLVFGIGANAMARQAFLERVFARPDILSGRNSGGGGEHRRDEHQHPCHDGSFQNPIQERGNAAGPAIGWRPARDVSTAFRRVCSRQNYLFRGGRPI